MTEKEAYEKKQQARLDEWTAEIDKLKAKAKQADADARLKIEEDLKQAEAIKGNIEDRLTKLRSSAGDAWKDIRGGVEAAASSLTSSLRSAAGRFA